ncbi:dTDP-4-dehydro-6-deoxyglucose aminotransferase [Streptomyces longispororuber]|uniref:dTDP-4-dehydro-6-deoxyglucose aminotransferase n=1 Tax=Streptomyces longispororuber TaxID=68230 RepID=UPI00210E513A|nr:dTDP-4-dehydro-6-deoxyglucose aminotransferase [Streptomyces longispororuber]MCQ4212348.1 dTDP-4-dehydro-6-deoxyglucose aminotransferase [Streptomyces longispororuber]
MKRALTDLALFGGPEAFLRPLMVGMPTVGDRARFLARLEWALDNDWLTNGGPLTTELEGRIADLAGVRYCVATCNATAALQLVLRASGVTGRVIMPSLTFAATPHAAAWVGLEPVFCDVDPVTGCLDPARVAELITPDTGAVLGVHLWGRTAPVIELEKLAAEHGVKLFFDAAHAFGCTAGDRPVGGFGDAEVFSLHATKTVMAFEGGAVTTDDGELAERLVALRNFGVDRTGSVTSVGMNAKMSEASAAMGLTSLDAFEGTRARNRENHALYASELRDVPGTEVLAFDEHERNNHQYLILRTDRAVTGLHRDRLRRLLEAEKVFPRLYFSPPCHLMPAYRTDPPLRLEHTERLSEQVLALPTGPSVSSEDIRRVCSIIRLAAERGEQIEAMWAQAVPA